MNPSGLIYILFLYIRVAIFMKGMMIYNYHKYVTYISFIPGSNINNIH